MGDAGRGILALVLLILIGLIGCNQAPPPSSQKADPAPVVKSSAEAVSPVSPPVNKEPASEDSLSFRAALLVENDVVVKTRLTGLIEEIYVDRGSRVKKGDPLFRLENNALKLELQRALVIRKQNEAEYDRARSLHDQELMSDSEFDEKMLAFDKARTEEEIARDNYEKSIVKAPFNGMVVERYAKIGQRVVEDDDVPLFHITSMEPLLARIFAPEEVLSRIHVGMAAEFVPSTDSSRKYPARVKWISTAIDPASGTAGVLVELKSGPDLPRPGTSGQITLFETH